jgi:hypothetical protein
MPMRKSILPVICVLVSSLLLHGCIERSESSTKGERNMHKVKGMAELRSGYSSVDTNWRALMTCWREKVSARLGVGGDNLLPLILSAERELEVTRLLDAKEQQLRVKLPASFRHFHLASAGMGWFSAVDGYDREENGNRTSIYPLVAIGPLAVIDGEAYKIWEGAGTEGIRKPAPEEYYRYGHGAGQIDNGFDGSRLREMIKIGGLEQGTLILLNQFEVTLDGEMETWVLSHWHGLVRYKSFAEMVREMAYRDINGRGGFLVPLDRIRATPCLGSVVIG